MIRFHSLSIIAATLCITSAVSAQVSWVNVDAEFGPLPPSVHVFRTNDSLDGKPNIAFYVKVPLKDPGIFFDADTALNRGLTPSAYFERNSKPLLVTNCTFFSPERRNVNLVIDRGEMVSFNIPSVFSKEDSLYHYVTRSAIGIDRHRNADVAWTVTDTSGKKAYEIKYGPVTGTGRESIPDIKRLSREDANRVRSNDGQGVTRNEGTLLRRPVRPWKMETAVGGGPTLITNGEINITNNEERMFSGKAINDRHPRTAMGYTSDGFLIILAVQGRFPGLAEGATLVHEAEMLRSLGCVEALNLDGGGSSCMLVNGRETIKPSDKPGQRPVPAVFLIRQTE
jgi:hypothetical protein